MTELSIVYVLTNPAMPGLVKIGRTYNGDPQGRITQLYTTGVPVPFNLEFACKVMNPDEVESALHKAFAPQRINPKREFFKIEPDQAIAILKLLHTEEATSEVRQQITGIDQESIDAGERLRRRRPNFNFIEMGIPLGMVLYSTQDDSTCTVVSEKRVSFNNEEMSLTAATRLMMGTDYDLAPGMYWTFDGRPLREIYNETYSIP